MRDVMCIEDLRHVARLRVPRMFFDYADGGSWSEITLRANEADFARLSFRQRIGVDISSRNITTSLLGQRVAMPVALAPIGMCGLQHADGEILAARAAGAFGVPFCLSTMSVCSIEDVAANTENPFWFQLYVMRDRAFVARLIERAAAALGAALGLTMDLPIRGKRLRDARNGLAAPPPLTPRFLLELARKPRWSLGMLRTRRRSFGNLVGHVEGVDALRSLEAWIQIQFDPAMNWDDVAWIRRLWRGPLVLKGVMDPEDARRAADYGADAIVVSNHGGRQLDGAPSTISALLTIVDAVGDRIEILVDGGVRSGQDVLRAVALGARGAMIGRAFVYGLGAFGGPGVTRCLEIIHEELSLTMGFCGATNIAHVDRALLANSSSIPHSQQASSGTTS